MKNIKRGAFIVFAALAANLSVYGQTAEELSVRRFGFYVASNDGGIDRQRLLYADDDVSTLSRTMADLGGISPVDEITLYEPDAVALDTAIEGMRAAIASAGSARRTEVFFYYSGHSDERGLMLGDDRYPYGHLKDGLESLEADVIVAILDSCSSGAFTRDKGGIRRAPFLLDDSSSMEGHAFLTSSSADEVSQESDAIGGSFFTHYLVSGLRGAADTTRDGRVTLNEIYQHTYAETLARTEQTLGGPQHPNYDIRLTGVGDLVLTDLSHPTASMILADDMSGRVSVRDETGRLVAEINKRPEETVTMALPAGLYDVAVQQERNRYAGSVELRRNRPETVYSGSLDRIRPEYTQFRGTEEDTRQEEVFSFGMTPSSSFPDVAEATVHFQPGFPIASAWGVEGIQAGFVMARATGGVSGFQQAFVGSTCSGPVSGVQAAGVFSETGGSLSGAQLSGVFNKAGGRAEGVQVAGVFNQAAGEMEGSQVALGFNHSSGSFHGTQVAGLWNVSTGFVNGAQISLFYNQADEIYGTQIGLVNVSRTSRGFLMGLVNISEDMRAFPLGLVNLSRTGIRNVDFRWEQDNRKYFSFKTGNRYYYTRFLMGFTEWDFFNNSDTLVFGFGAGFRFSLKPFYFECDLDGRTALADYSMYSDGEEAWDHFLVLPTLSLTAGVGKRFGIYGGVGFTLRTPGMDRDSVLLDGGNSVNFDDDGNWGGTFKWYAGLHF